MNIVIVKDAMSFDELTKAAADSFGDMVKVVVDIKREFVAVGGELHADAETLLLEDGSQQENLWGANIYPELPADKRIEYTSLINIRSSQGNRSREIQIPEIRTKVLSIIEKRIQMV